VPPDQLKSMLGIARVTQVHGQHPLAIVDTPLGA
jgi:hypothetical protein